MSKTASEIWKSEMNIACEGLVISFHKILEHIDKLVDIPNLTQAEAEALCRLAAVKFTDAYNRLSIEAITTDKPVI